MVSENEMAVRVILERILANKLTLDDAVKEVIKVTKSEEPLSRVERRRWKRKEFSAEGNMSIVYSLKQQRVSRTEKVLVTSISMGGIRIRTPFLSLDGLHIVGELGAQVWMPNILSLEVSLPTSFQAKIRFQGNAQWYLRAGTDPCYSIGIAINVISMEHRELMFRFLLAEGSDS